MADEPNDETTPAQRLSDLNDDRWMLELVPAEGQVSLVEPSTVEGILRFYTKELIDITGQKITGALTTEQAAAKMKAEADRIQRIFYSQDQAFKTQPTWNRAGTLGRFLVDSVGLGGDIEDAVARLMASYWDELAPSLAAFTEGKINEDMFVNVVVEDLLVRYRHYLMGVRLPENYTVDD